MIRAGRFLVKEEHVGFDTLSVEDTGGQAQQRMHVTLLQQFAANSFTCSTLEEYVIRDNHSRPTMNLEQGFDMLDKVQLLVAGAGPEVVAHKNAGLDDYAGYQQHALAIGPVHRCQCRARRDSLRTGEPYCPRSPNRVGY